jgi:hypothetical protein
LFKLEHVNRGWLADQLARLQVRYPEVSSFRRLAPLRRGTSSPRSLTPATRTAETRRPTAADGSCRRESRFPDPYGQNLDSNLESKF